MPVDRRHGPASNASRHSRRRALGLGAGAVAIALAACRGNASVKSAPGASATTSGTPKAGGMFSTYVNQNPSTLDGIALYNLSTWPLSSSVLSRLVRSQSDLNPQTAVSNGVERDLAVSLESPDGLTWVAKLRPDARFQSVAPVNGRAVDAEDVKASMSYAIRPENSGSPFLTMIDAAQIETPAADTVSFKLKSVYGPFQQTIAGPGFVIPREGVTGGYDLSKAIIGSGPFIMESYQPDVALSYKKNPDWFETNRPYVDSMRAPVIPDAALQNAQFIAGALDELSPAATDEATIKKQRPDSSMLPITETPVWVIYGHMDRPGPYRDLRVRQAISVALDRVSLGKGILNDSYTDNPVLGTEYGKWALASNQVGSASDYLKFDLATAKKLVAASGAGDQVRKFAYIRDVYGQDKMAEAINPMLNAAGFQTELLPLDYQKDYTNGGKGYSAGNYPTDTIVLARYGIGVPTPEDYLRLTSQPGLTRNPSQVDDGQLTDMINKMLALRDDNQRLEAVYAIQRYLAGQLYLIPVPVPVLHRFVAARVRNYCYAINANAGTGTYAKLWLS
jgi:ABC-type transport system substrate-binding protein